MKKYPSIHYKTKKRSRIKIPSSQSKTVKHIGGMYDGTRQGQSKEASPKKTHLLSLDTSSKNINKRVNSSRKRLLRGIRRLPVLGLYAQIKLFWRNYMKKF